MTRLEEALSVGQIATFNFITCDADSDPQTALDQYPDFDQIPVQKEGKVVGVLERGKLQQPTAAETMRPLVVDMLVAAEEPLSRFIPCLLEQPYYRLVLNGQELNGIVTRSDLLKLPVRLWAFARVTHLELILATVISAHCPHWFELLEKKEQKHIKSLYNRLQKKRIEPALLEVSGFEHKYKVVSTLMDPDGTFIDDMAAIKDLRDDLAHAKDFAADEEALQNFLGCLQTADYWISELSNRPWADVADEAASEKCIAKGEILNG